MNKSRLRTSFKQERQKLSAEQVAELSEKIIGSTWQIINWTDIHSLHCFLPITNNNEIDTLPLLKTAIQANPELKIATANINQETFWLNKQFKPAKQVPANFQFGLIIVPMLGFDQSGYRLGYGGGYYDKFLASQNQAQIIGVCYELGNLPKLPHEEHDIPLQTIITEKSIHKF